MKGVSHAACHLPVVRKAQVVIASEVDQIWICADRLFDVQLDVAFPRFPLHNLRESRYPRKLNALEEIWKNEGPYIDSSSRRAFHWPVEGFLHTVVPSQTDDASRVGGGHRVGRRGRATRTAVSCKSFLVGTQAGQLFLAHHVAHGSGQNVRLVGSKRFLTE